MILDVSQRETLGRLADELIPAGSGFPSASQAGAAGEHLDALVKVRPELLEPLRKILAEAAHLSAPEFIAQARAHDPAAFGVLAEVIPGAYFLNPDIRARLNYAGQESRPLDAAPDYEDLLPSVQSRGPIYRPTVEKPSGGYEWKQSYDWNFEHAPAPLTAEPLKVPGSWTYAGLKVSSPLAIAAGPLLNGAWILYYASLGFDVLTYKTVRSRARTCYPMPNLQPIVPTSVGFPAQAPSRSEGEASPSVTALSAGMNGSWAVSFGMPSKDPSFWRADIESTRKALAKDKLLSVSIVATPEPHWNLDEVAADFAKCARWAVESGADCVEANFSCPNVASADAQLYQHPEHAATVAQAVRAAIGSRPLLIKVGHVPEESAAGELAKALAPYVQALAMVNCVSATIALPDGQPLFNGEKRGIAGPAIRGAALEQVRLFTKVIAQHQLGLRIVGVGGIGSASDVRAHLDAGAEAVQLASAAMLDPGVGLRIRRGLASSQAHAPTRA